MPDPGHEKQGARIWVAFHSDYSGFAVFADELSCRRYAMDHHMDAGEFELGRDVRDQVNEQYTAWNGSPDA